MHTGINCHRVVETAMRSAMIAIVVMDIKG